MNARKADKTDKAWRSVCPIARTLELVGDKWSLLLIRDMRFGKRTYGELLDSPEGIPTNILADRLKRLEEAGLAVRSEYQDRPVRYAYTLTEKGQDLGNVLLALKRWGEANIPGSRALRQPAAPSRRKVSVSGTK
ncbi:MAG TPA: helix-turn-helix domain-containing protein [Burkholderiales bacterium]|nr:helix-turn-helix domain-containing protein [Burkholderiales bacterium]